MAINIAINGFGRIGRLILRAIAESNNSQLRVVAINDLGSLEASVHLFQYDSIHGRFPNPVKIADQSMNIGMGEIKVLCESSPDKLPWRELDIDLVLECSGVFTNRSRAQLHLVAGARRVLISAPTEGADITVVYGVNHQELKYSHYLISNASCTTNCLAPLAYILHYGIGIEQGHMTTIHAYTSDQQLVDSEHKDLRRARAAALSMIPSTTGAAKAVGLVLPELKGKIEGAAIRVPTPNVSLIDFTFIASRATSVYEINEKVQQAAMGSFKGIISVIDKPLVSIDFNHSVYSTNFDLTQTRVIENHLCRILAWYDNEWGFANRMVDNALAISKL